MNTLIVGPAASGKTLLTYEFGRYLEENYSVRYINLDAGVTRVPYNPDFDIRDHYTLEEIMVEEDLGPNGATLVAVDRLSDINVPKFGDDFVLIDTPGQLEPFVFRGGSEAVKDFSECSIYLIDATAPMNTFPSQYLYSLAVQYALQTPTLRVLNKVDLLEPEEIDELENLMMDPRVLREFGDVGMRTQMNIDIADFLAEMSKPFQFPAISAETWEGFENMLTWLLESFPGGPKEEL